MRGIPASAAARHRHILLVDVDKEVLVPVGRWIQLEVGGGHLLGKNVKFEMSNSSETRFSDYGTQLSDYCSCWWWSLAGWEEE